MSDFCSILPDSIGVIQSRLDLYIPEIPKDAVKGILRSFACSFTISAFLSGGNPHAGLIGGSLGVLATIVHIVFMTALENLNSYLSQRLNKPKEPISFEGRHCVFLFSWGGVLYLGNVLGLAINNKASFFSTIPFLIWNNTFGKAPTKTPVMGMIIM